MTRDPRPLPTLPVRLLALVGGLLLAAWVWVTKSRDQFWGDDDE